MGAGSSSPEAQLVASELTYGTTLRSPLLNGDAVAPLISLLSSAKGGSGGGPGLEIDLSLGALSKIGAYLVRRLARIDGGACNRGFRQLLSAGSGLCLTAHGGSLQRGFFRRHLVC